MAAAVGGALLGLLLAGGLSLRLRRAASIAERVTAGELDARINATGHDEVAKLGEAIDRMAEAMRLRIERERRFVADVAHDLRTPLTGLKTAVQPARPRPGRRRHPRAGRPAAAAGRGPARDRPAGQRHGHRRPALGRPGRVRHRAWSGTRRARPSARTARRRRLVDPRRLERVIENVLDNAARHGAPPVEVSVSDGRIVMRDHGPGFSDAMLAHAAERFTTGNPGPRRRDRAGPGHRRRPVPRAGRRAASWPTIPPEGRS